LSIKLTHHTNFSTNSTPILILNGDLDPLVPSYYSTYQATQIKSPILNNYIIPYSFGMTLLNSPVFSEPNSTNLDCGMQIFLSFLNNTLISPDSSCLDHILPIDFQGDLPTNIFYLGVEDIYNGIYVGIINPLVIDFYYALVIYSATCVILLVLLGCLVYYVLQLKSKINEQKINIEDEEEEFVEE